MPFFLSFKANVLVATAVLRTCTCRYVFLVDACCKFHVLKNSQEGLWHRSLTLFSSAGIRKWSKHIRLAESWVGEYFQETFFFVLTGNSSSGHRLCPRGFYCPTGTGRNWTACPIGTFSNVLGLEMETECQPCPGGMFCDLTNLTAPSGACNPGFYCTVGVDTPTPSGSHLGEGGICPEGHFCPGETTLPEGCLAGFYQVREG